MTHNFGTVRSFEHPEFTVKSADSHVHGFLMNATIAEDFTRIAVFFPVDPPMVDSQRFRLRDSDGRVYEGTCDDELGDRGASFRNWTFPRLADGADSFSVEFALDAGQFEMINGLVI
jgi:hypothetical protein